MGAKAVPTNQGSSGDGVGDRDRTFFWGEGDAIVVCGDRRRKPLPEGEMHARYLRGRQTGRSHWLFACISGLFQGRNNLLTI
jgi:hypothetical protein